MGWLYAAGFMVFVSRIRCMSDGVVGRVILEGPFRYLTWLHAMGREGFVMSAYTGSARRQLNGFAVNRR